MKKILKSFLVLITALVSIAVIACDEDSSKISSKSVSRGQTSSIEFVELESTQVGQSAEEIYSSVAISQEQNSMLNNSQLGQASSSRVEQTVSQGLEYTLIDGGYEVTGIGTCTDSEIVIPSTYNDLPVISIGFKAFYENYDIVHVTIGDNVEEIGDGAFLNCENLFTVTIGEKVSVIGEEAFTYCEK